MAVTLDECVNRIRSIQGDARRGGIQERPRWPIVILRSPKGWTAPKKLDEHQLEGYWRAHQIPIPDVAENPAHLKILEEWMRGDKPEELFDASGKLVPELKEMAPAGKRRMSANPHANGGLLRKLLRLSNLRGYAALVTKPGILQALPTHILGEFLRDVMRDNVGNFGIFGPEVIGVKS